MSKNNVIQGIIGNIIYSISVILFHFIHTNLGIGTIIITIVIVGISIIICSFYYDIQIFFNNLQAKFLFVTRITIHGIFILLFTIYFNYILREKFSVIELQNELLNISIIIASIVLLYVTIISLLPRKQISNIGFVSTCFPLRYIDDKHLETRLIYNPNHNQWMFPGGHINIQKGEQPDEIAEKKAQQEAGIKITKLIGDDSQFTNYAHCQKMISPCFTYRMTINNSVICRKTMGHNEHIDYIFIGEYEPINDGNTVFEFVDVKIEIDNNDASIEKLRALLRETINAHYINRTNNKAKPGQIDLLEDIPERLYLAIIKYKIYKKNYNNV